MTMSEPWSASQSGSGEDVVVARRKGARTTRRLDRASDKSGPTLTDFESLARGELDSVVLAERYRVTQHLRSGGMADVFAGEHLVSRQPVALKIITRRYADEAYAMEALIREARLNAQVRHPNVVHIFDIGSTQEGIVFLAMERLEGEDLRTLLHDCGPLSWAQARNYMLQICTGLAVLHRTGLLHRDLKPSNCFCVADGAEDRIKLLDFGLVTVVDQSAETGEWREEYGEIGELSGTPAYMSPEQASGQELDYRSDVYSAGVLLCEMLTGGLPKRELLEGDPGPPPALAELNPALRGLDPRIEAVYQRALAFDPEQRFASIEDMARALEAIPANGAHESLVLARLSSAELEEPGEGWMSRKVELSRGALIAWVGLGALLLSLAINLLLAGLS